MPIGTTEMLMIAGVVVLLFGTSKLPKLGQNLGEGIRNFKRSIADAKGEPLTEQAQLPEKKT